MVFQQFVIRLILAVFLLQPRLPFLWQKYQIAVLCFHRVAAAFLEFAVASTEIAVAVVEKLPTAAAWLVPGGL